MNSDTLSIINTTRFNAVGKGGIPKRVRVPLKIQSLVASSLPYDPRKQGDRPTKLDIYSHLVDIGLNHYISESADKRTDQNPFGLTDTVMTVHSNTEDVIWLSEKTNDAIKEMFGIHNAYLAGIGGKRLRGVVPIVCALMNKGAELCKINVL